MRRIVKRAAIKHNKTIDKIVRSRTIKTLKEMGIDFIIQDDKVLSNRKKDVERVFNTAMMNTMLELDQFNGDIHKLKEIHNFK